MTNQMHQVLDSTVYASQQLGTPWQLMVFLVLILILIITAMGWFGYKIITNRFQREADISKDLQARIDSLTTALAKASEDRDEVDRQIAKSNSDLAVAISGLKDTVARLHPSQVQLR